MVNFLIKLVNGDVLKFPAQNVTPDKKQEAIAMMVMHLADVPAIHSERAPAVMTDKILSIDVEFEKPRLVVDNTKVSNVVPINRIKGQLELDFDGKAQLSLF